MELTNIRAIRTLLRGLVGLWLASIPAGLAWASPFSIADLANVQWWASAEDSQLFQNPGLIPSGTVATGNPVGWIEDLSGLSHHAMMGDSVIASGNASRPTYIADAVRGNPAIRYDGVNDFSNLGASLVHGATAYSFAFAIQANDSLSNKNLWGGLSGTQNASVSFTSPSGRPRAGLRLTGGAVSPIDTTGLALQSGYTGIIIGRFQAGGTGELWMNGTLRATVTVPSGTVQAVQQKFLGTFNSASNATNLTPAAGYAPIDFFEGVVTQSYLSDTQMADLYDDLSRRWTGVQEVKSSKNLYWDASKNTDRLEPTISAGHLQGVAADRNHRYAFHTNLLEKYDANWTLLTSNAQVFAGVPTNHGPLAHMGDGDFLDGKIFAPIENGFGGSGQFIAVYDSTAPGLPLLTAVDITAQHHEVSSIVVVPEHGDHGVMYVTSFYGGSDKLWMYDYQDGNILTPGFGAFLGTLNIPAAVVNIQGVEYANGYFYFTVSGGPDGIVVDRVQLLPSGLATTAEVVATGNTTIQGLAIVDDLGYIAYQHGSTTELVRTLRNLSEPVPEPSTGLLAVIGALAVAALRRGRRTDEKSKA